MKALMGHRPFSYRATRHLGLLGLGQDESGDIFGGGIITNNDPIPTIATVDVTGSPIEVPMVSSPNPYTLEVPTVSVPNPSSIPQVISETPLTPGNLCPDGSAPFSDGSCAETSGAPSASDTARIAAAAAAQISAALSRAVAPGAGNSCPAGFVYGAPGQSVQLAPGVATIGAGKCLPVTSGVSGQWISGVQNSTLVMIVGGVAIAVLLISSLSGGKGRRR